MTIPYIISYNIILTIYNITYIIRYYKVPPKDFIDKGDLSDFNNDELAACSDVLSSSSHIQAGFPMSPKPLVVLDTKYSRTSPVRESNLFFKRDDSIRYIYIF